MADTQADEIAAVLFTTGSTGPGKGRIFIPTGYSMPRCATSAPSSASPRARSTCPPSPLFALFRSGPGDDGHHPGHGPHQAGPGQPGQDHRSHRQPRGHQHVLPRRPCSNRVGRHGKEKGHPAAHLENGSSRPVRRPRRPTSNNFAPCLPMTPQIHTGYGATEAMPVSSFGSERILNENPVPQRAGLWHVRGPADFRNRRPHYSHHRRPHRPLGPMTWPWRKAKSGRSPYVGIRSPAGIFERPGDDAKAKIDDGDTFWHRMGDLGWMDKKKNASGSADVKNHRVVTEKKNHVSVSPAKLFSTTIPGSSAVPWWGVGPPGAPASGDLYRTGTRRHRQG